MTKRLPSVDFLRGFSIVAMIQTHLWVAFFAPVGGVAEALHRWLVAPLGGHAAPLFVLVSGMSAHLAVRALRRRACEEAIVPTFLKRGLALFGLSTVVNVAAGPWLHFLDISLLNWGVIQLIGLCLCLVPQFVRLRGFGKAVWVVAPLILSGWICPTVEVARVFCSGFAPPFPWAALFFAGFLVGEGYTWAWQSGSVRRLCGLASIGLFLVVPLGLLLNAVYRPLVWTHTPNMSLTSAFVFMGDFVLLVALCGYLLDYRGPQAKVVDSVVGLGQHALTLYYLQLGGIVLLPTVLRHIVGHRPVLGPIWFLPLLLVVLLLCHVIINVLWRHFDYRLSLEWWLSLLMKGRPGRVLEAE